MSLDIEASRFLANFQKLRERETQDQLTLVTEEKDVIPHTAHLEVCNVILSREQEPRFFAGVLKSSGRPVWTADMAQAKVVSADYIHLYENKFGHSVLPLWPYAR